MTFTIAEVFLLLWALGASLFALHFYRDASLAKQMIFEILDDEKLRNHMIDGHKKIIKELDAQ